MCSGEAFKAISRVQAMQAWGPLLCLEGAYEGQGDVPQDWAASLGAVPCPSVLCHVPCCHAVSLTIMPCPLLLCHVPRCCAMSLAVMLCPSPPRCVPPRPRALRQPLLLYLLCSPRTKHKRQSSLPTN